MPGSPPPQGPRRRLGGLAILATILVALILFGSIAAGIIALSRQGNTATVSTPTPAASKPTATASQGTGKPTAAFSSAPCPFALGSGITNGQQVNCGYVSVPENHDVSSSNTIKLAVAIFKAPQYMNSTDPSPVLRLEGGPGGPSLDNLAHYVDTDTYGRFIFNHNLIMVDQRGTGYSTPSLKCPELINLQYSSTDVSQQTYEKAAQACHDRLVSQGINLSNYNSIQNADDVASIIQALGYKQMTLYGVSYGTRLALTTMRIHPEVIKSVVLDSVYPNTHNRNDLPSDAQRVFDVLFQGCAKDATCNSKYPKLQSTFYSLVDTLNAHPTTFNTVDPSTNQQYKEPLSGNDLLSWLFSALYVTSFIPLLPQTIFQVKAHQYTQFSQLYGVLEFDSTFSDGMFYSATCSEDWAFLTQADITKSEQGITPQINAVFGSDEQSEYAVCKSWNVQAVPAVQKQPIVSSIPTLALAGEYDPITPPTNAQEVARTLSNSYYFLFPGQGHGQEYSSSCSDLIISAFEDNPTQKPPSTCIAQMGEPAFQ